MTFVLEANVVFFPEERPSPQENEPRLEWTQEQRQKYFHQEAEIHLLRFGPVSQELLDSKLVHMDLQGIPFIWNEKTQDYQWQSEGPEKGMPYRYLAHFRNELKKVGIDKQEVRGGADDNRNCVNVEKQIWFLVSKF